LLAPNVASIILECKGKRGMSRPPLIEEHPPGGWKRSPETRANISAAAKTRKYTPEGLAKMKAAALKREEARRNAGPARSLDSTQDHTGPARKAAPQGKTIPLSEIITKFGPFLEELEHEGKKHAIKACPAAVAEIAVRIKRQFAKWAE
jgi:hypothetical protein